MCLTLAKQGQIMKLGPALPSATDSRDNSNEWTLASGKAESGSDLAILEAGDKPGMYGIRQFPDVLFLVITARSCLCG